MSRNQSKTDEAGRLLLRKIILLIFATLFLVAITPFLIVWYGEKERQDLMRDYEVPQIFLARIIALGRTVAKALMESDERIVCAVNSYAGVEKIKDLNEDQKLSIQKDKLPSEDGLWYLIFFSEIEATRIYLIENAAIDGITSGSDGCIGKNGSFEIVRQQPRDTTLPSGYNVFVIRMKKGDL